MQIRTALILALIATGCKPSAEVKTSAFIIGVNDIQKYDSGSSANDKVIQKTQHASVLLATPVDGDKRKFCTGTLIAADPSEPTLLRVLTSFHCFAVTDAQENVFNQLIPQACVGTSVYLNFVAGQTDNATVIPCKEGSLKTDYDGDTALFTLSKQAPAEAQPLDIWDKPAIPANLNAVVVHYPDVAENFVDFGNPPIRLPVAAITKDDCIIKGDFSVEEWNLDHTLPYSVRHTCDLLHGSSGSGLVNAETGELMGVNWGGIKINYASSSQTTNVAIKADFVNAFLANNLQAYKDAKHHTEGDATAKTSAEASAEPDSSHKSIASQAKHAACGVISSMPTNSSAKLAWFMMMLPLLMSFLPRRLPSKRA